MKLSLVNLQKEVRDMGDPKKAILLAKFFKTGKGEYAEGDAFIGLTNPICHKLVKKYRDLSIKEVNMFLKSQIHEERLIALLVLVDKFKKSDTNTKEVIYKSYLKNTKYINNWDLVDLSAHKIVGEYLHLQGGTLQILDELTKSRSLWERRIAIMTTYAFTKADKYEKTLEISEKLLNDKEDLIHKAVGWMLREIGNRDRKIEEDFLKKHYKNMPRTMLRYAIEKFPEELRLKYLKGEI